MKLLMASLLILIGIGVASFPFIKSQYSLHQQEQLLTEWNQSNQETARQSFTSLSKVYASEENKEQTKTFPTTGELIGTISISSIDLTLPILEGATIPNLKKGAGRLEGTALLGEKGNAAIAAHRSYTYGKDFNRLDELEDGDEIIITTETSTYTYIVDNTLRVLPDDTSVLASNQDQSIITLITCDPIKDPTHRLIVQASIKKTW
ncbi:class D sortase [Pseudalkalibacillus sp. Hm43]|uniref:class D sortase n=1 Tax=Pseudalkalibacillus sp. Hm43 TaxID=3450742 RepID=UPI003F430E5E